MPSVHCVHIHCGGGSAPSSLIIAVSGPVVSFREENRRRKIEERKKRRGRKLTSSKTPQNNASFYNHWVHKVTIDRFLLVVYLICIELSFLEAWVHVLGLNLRLGGMDLEMLILSLRLEKGSLVLEYLNVLK